MKDMFYNYDNNIDKKEYPIPIIPWDKTRCLESNPNIEIAKDIKGNEIGVRVKYGGDFKLFFNLFEEEPFDYSLNDLVQNSSILFEILDSNHWNIITKELSAKECYDTFTNTIKVNITLSDSEKLKREVYRMRLTLIWPDGKYELYSENNGLLIVR